MAKGNSLTPLEEAYNVLKAEKDTLGTAERSHMSALDFIRRIQRKMKQDVAEAIIQFSQVVGYREKPLMAITIDDFLRHMSSVIRRKKGKQKK